MLLLLDDVVLETPATEVSGGLVSTAPDVLLSFLRVARPRPAAGAEGAVVVTEPADPEPDPEAAAAVLALWLEVEAVRLLRASAPCRPRLGREVQRSGDEDELPPELGRFLLLFRLLLAVFVTPRTVVRDSDPPNTLLGCSAIDAPHLLSHATINMPP